MNTHWSQVYTQKSVTDVSWYQNRPDQSLQWLQQTGIPADAPLLDVGAGASTLVDHLLALGYTHLTMLDIAPEALQASQARLGQPLADQVTWQVGDITMVELPPQHYAVWHDRAVFHFLTDPAQQASYARQMRHAIQPGGHILMATFATDGPTQCSGLNVMQYDAQQLQQVLGADFTLVSSWRETHITPWNSEQRFLYSYFRR
ncbi:MAG: class I SAM-dependent methyltransferase [Phototrophicaceae bacterium]|jgi:2-polyprenyl-3-methyl-5-hydroxy-6-metoxy-1,4-benzoquinol methylase